MFEGQGLKKSKGHQLEAVGHQHADSGADLRALYYVMFPRKVQASRYSVFSTVKLSKGHLLFLLNTSGDDRPLSSALPPSSSSTLSHSVC